MSEIRSASTSLLGLIGAWSVGVLLGGSAVWVASDDGRVSSTDPAAIESQFADLRERMDEQQRAFLEALTLIEARAEESRRSATLEEEAPVEPPTEATQSQDPALRTELAALREEIARMNHDRTVGEIGALVREFQLPVIERKEVTLEELLGMRPEERSAALRWRSFGDIQAAFGAPTRFMVTGTVMLWEYDHPVGGRLGIRFVNGRVVDAWN